MSKNIYGAFEDTSENADNEADNIKSIWYYKGQEQDEEKSISYREMDSLKAIIDQGVEDQNKMPSTLVDKKTISFQKEVTFQDYKLQSDPAQARQIEKSKLTGSLSKNQDSSGLSDKRLGSSSGSATSDRANNLLPPNSNLNKKRRQTVQPITQKGASSRDSFKKRSVRQSEKTPSPQKSPPKDFIFENSELDDDLGPGMNIQPIDENFQMDISSATKKKRPVLENYVEQEFKLGNEPNQISKKKIEPVRTDVQKRKKIKIQKTLQKSDNPIHDIRMNLAKFTNSINKLGNQHDQLSRQIQRSLKSPESTVYQDQSPKQLMSIIKQEKLERDQNKSDKSVSNGSQKKSCEQKKSSEQSVGAAMQQSGIQQIHAGLSRTGIMEKVSSIKNDLSKSIRGKDDSSAEQNANIESLNKYLAYGIRKQMRSHNSYATAHGFQSEDLYKRVDTSKHFKPYQHLFNNLTKIHTIATPYQVVITVLVTKTCSRVVALCKESDKKFIINHYDLEKFEQIYLPDMTIEGEELNANILEQNSKGEVFAIMYIDSEIWHLRIFDSFKTIADFNLTEYFGIKSLTEPILGFFQPLACCCFYGDDNIFVNFFQQSQKLHYHFSCKKVIENGEISYEVNKNLFSYKIEECSEMNFPQRSFFDQIRDQIYCFYRQGNLVTIKIQKDESDLTKVDEQKITNYDLGDLFMYKNMVLIARSSQQILFFKFHKRQTLNASPDAPVGWNQYHSIKSRGFVNGRRQYGSFQVIEDKYIKLFEICPETMKPILKNVMVNFIGCSMLLFGEDKDLCITYKTNQEGLNMFVRRMTHDFKTKIISKNYNKSIGINIDSFNNFMVANEGQLIIYDDFCYEEQRRIDLKLDKSNDSFPDIILALKMNQNSKMLLVVIGKQLKKEKQMVTKIKVLKSKRYHDPAGMLQMTFVPVTDLVFSDYNLTAICKEMYFDIEDEDKIVMIANHQVIKLNYITIEIEQIYQIDFSLEAEFFVFNSKQDSFVVASEKDALLIDMRNMIEIDLDNEFQISDFKSILYDEGYFYLMANKRYSKLGFYLIKLEQYDLLAGMNKQNESKEKEKMFLINQMNKLDIGDIDINIRIDNQYNDWKSTVKGRQLLVSYKSIYINTYSVFAINLDTGCIIFRHESFCLWESKISSFLNSSTFDYISLQQQGISVLALSKTQSKIIQVDKYMHKLHSLQSCDYLKLDRQNTILYECSQDTRILSVQSQYKDQNGETHFEDIINIELCPMSLRDLLIVQSIYYIENQVDILKFVQMQGDHSIFYKSFLELDRRNMISLLAFDSNSVKTLLSEDNNKYFRKEFPLFYKNKKLSYLLQNGKMYKQYCSDNAIDVAIENNQVRGVGIMIDHIVKYQSNYVSAFLFRNNLLKLMKKGIAVHKLISSNVFSYTFEFEEWPAAHTNLDKIMVPYNDSIFSIRTSYHRLFDNKIENKDNDQNDQIYKIKYTLNMLPFIREDDNNETLMAVCQEKKEQELEIFSSEALKNLIKFKWEEYAYFLHYLGAFMHVMYICTMTLYIYFTFLTGTYGQQSAQIYTWIMLLGIIYPFTYDSIQMYMEGLQYFNDQWNWTDIMFQFFGAVNITFQFTTSPHDLTSTISMTGVLLLALIKTMFFLRIFDNLSYLVTLIRNVIYDLRLFLIFYSILIFMFSLIFGVMGFQNYSHDEELTKHFEERGDYPGIEYKEIGRFYGNIVSVVRMSLGDFDFSAIKYMDTLSNKIFWLAWICIILMTCIIFLNFIIAEASASYEKVVQNIDNYLIYEKCSMINESENMLYSGRGSRKDKKKFPMFLIIREMDS